MRTFDYIPFRVMPTLLLVAIGTGNLSAQGAYLGTPEFEPEPTVLKQTGLTDMKPDGLIEIPKSVPILSDEPVRAATISGCPTPDGRFWLSGEWLYWDARGSSLPPLVTMSAPGTARGAAGVLGAPATTTLFGGSKILDEWMSGFRINGGIWLNDDKTLGLESSFLFRGDEQEASFGSSGTPIIARPFSNAATNRPDAQLVAFPGVVAGTVTMAADSDLWGADCNIIRNVTCGCFGRVDVFIGYRNLNLDERLAISESLISLGGQVGTTAGTRIIVDDIFETDSAFHGGQFGIATSFQRGRVSARIVGKIGLGATIRETEIQGATRSTLLGAAAVTRTGGLLAQSTNIGSYEESDFSILPQVDVKIAVRVTRRLSVFAGYTFLYWTKVGRAGEQIDLGVNPTQIPPGTLVGPARPLFFDRTSHFWAQGVNAGLILRY